MKNKKTIIGIGIILILIIGIIDLLIPDSKSELLINGVEVEEDSELTYYLTISYDGKDKYGVSSSATSLSEVQSGILEVEDKIPNGLIFLGFEETADGTIGAVEQSDSSKACLGRVIDDTGQPTATTYHGLHYDPNTRTVSFKIENIQAGCELTIGIRTRTPFIDDPNTVEVETRRDFYNHAVVNENDNNDTSEDVHVFIGDEDELLYEVNYEYDSLPPPNAPSLQSGATYPENAEVSVNMEPKLEGYEFLGWTSNDVAITNGKFTMPNHDVTIHGSFQSITSYKVTYQISGTTPTGYVLPTEKYYYPNSYVELDTLSPGDVIGNYRFLGWTNNEILTNNNQYFEMPNHDIIITGQFEDNKYTLSYQFYDTVLPPGADTLLPSNQYHYAGETVTLDDVNDINGYQFLGWYQENGFIMPESDIMVYGEWKQISGTFQPTITKVVTTTKDYYRFNDTIQYKTTITNNENYALEDVLISNNIDSFVTGVGYEVLSNHLVRIPTLPANSSIEITSTYTITSEDSNIVISKSEITGALSSNNYELAEANYEASVTSNLQTTLKICCYVNGVDDGNSFQYIISGINNHYESSMLLAVGECKTIYLSPGNYKVMEIIPQEYELLSVTGDSTFNGATLLVSQANQYEINYTNRFRKKGFYHSFGRIENHILGGGS